MENFGRHIQATMRLFENIRDVKPEERESELQKHRQKSSEILSAELKAVLDADQQSREHQQV